MTRTSHTTRMPHTSAPASIPRVLRLVQHATVPTRVTGPYLEASGGLKTGEGAPMVGLLRGIGFVDAQGRPTSRWEAYRDAGRAPRVLAEVVRVGYAPLFDAFPHAEARAADELTTVVRETTTYAEPHVVRTVESFTALCAKADFANPPRTGPVAHARTRLDAALHLTTLRELNATMTEAIRCIDHDLNRPAHVSAWNGFVGLALTVLSADDFAALRTVRPNWSGSTAEELAMRTSGGLLIDTLTKLKLCSVEDADTLGVLLQRRDDCAHPSSYAPTADEALDYVESVTRQAHRLMARANRDSATAVGV